MNGAMARSWIMRSMAYSNKKTSDLIDAYRKAAAQQGKLADQGNAKAANKQYQILAKIVRLLRSRGKDDQAQLASLLNDTNPYVQLWAAAHSLEFAPVQAEAALKKIMADCKNVRLVSFMASVTLDEWKKGKLVFP